MNRLPDLPNRLRPGHQARRQGPAVEVSGDVVSGQGAGGVGRRKPGPIAATGAEVLMRIAHLRPGEAAVEGQVESDQREPQGDRTHARTHMLRRVRVRAELMPLAHGPTAAALSRMSADSSW